MASNGSVALAEAPAYGIEDRRRENELVQAAYGTMSADIPFEDFAIAAPWGSIPIRAYMPSRASRRPAVMFIHGGGWCMGNSFVTDPWAVPHLYRSNIAVFSIDYRLAPEARHPAALDDCHFALTWISNNCGKLGVDPNRIGITGGSSGGNLAAVLALKARNEGGPQIVCQSLTVPIVDVSDTTDWKSYAGLGDSQTLTVSEIRAIAARYVSDAGELLSPYVSPLLERNLGRLPKALILVAELDPLRDQGIAYADALKQAGVEVSVREMHGVGHELGGINSPASEEAHRLETAFFLEALA